MSITVPHRFAFYKFLQKEQEKKKKDEGRVEERNDGKKEGNKLMWI